MDVKKGMTSIMEPNQTTNSSPPRTPANTLAGRVKKRWLTLVVVAVVAFLGGLGYWFIFERDSGDEGIQPVVTEQVKTYQDQVISFEYPSAWTAKRINDISSAGGYLITIKSDLIKEGNATNQLKTKSQITANIWIKKKGAPTPTCYSCTVQDIPNSQLLAFRSPSGLFFEPVFGTNSAIFGSPVIMSINSKKLAAGTKDYKSSVRLPNGNIVVVKAQMEYQEADSMVAVSKADDFFASQAYKKLESLIFSLEIK